MKITDIKQQVKRKQRYSIFVDSKYSFSLSENELMSSGIRIGREYDKAEFEQLKKTAVLDKAYARVLDLLARRVRSEWEIRDYLKRKEYEPEIIEQTVMHLQERGYINDEIFAKSWIDSRHLLKNISKRKLQMELKQKRVSEEIITSVLEDDETDERDVLAEFITKKRQQTKYQDDLKLMQYLSRQGFSYDDIKSVMQRLDSGED